MEVLKMNSNSPLKVYLLHQAEGEKSLLSGLMKDPFQVSSFFPPPLPSLFPFLLFSLPFPLPFSEHLLYARHHIRHWGYSNELGRCPCSCGVYSPPLLLGIGVVPIFSQLQIMVQ